MSQGNVTTSMPRKEKTAPALYATLPDGKNTYRIEKTHRFRAGGDYAPHLSIYENEK